jgi:hypothetical protein
MVKSWERYGNWTVKGLLVVLLLVGLLFPDLPRFEGKAWPLRVAFYPLFALVVPLFWLRRGRSGAYPHLADMFLVIPFVSDTLGNVANLFDTVDITDDILHFVNWMFLVAALVVGLASRRLARWNRIMLGAGAGAMAIIIWESIEYLIMVSGTTGLNLTYGDTVGDLALSAAGGVAGAMAVVLLRIGEPRARAGPEPREGASPTVAAPE